MDSVNIRMQSGHGQYGGVPGIQQFVVEGCSSPHGLFAALSQEQINHNTNHPLQARQAIQQVGFQNQKVLQQHQLGLQGPESSDASLRSRDKAYASSLRETTALGHVQGRDQVPPQPLTDDDGGGDEGERGGGGVNRWPREETLALLRIRSGLDTNFRDSNIKGPLWENVSRKLGELGYYRSAKKCKEKFENISKYYKKTKDGRIGRQDGKSYRFFSELEALYSNSHGGSRSANRTTGQEVTGIGGPEKTSNAASLNLSSDNTSEDDHCNNTPLQNPSPPKTLEQVNRKKRKRKHLASITAFFESLVKQVMGHQEELHRKFLEAIDRREQERLKREETWKRQEMARLNRETELRAQEHALASSREAAIVAFLQKITGQNLNLPTSVPPPSVPTEPPTETQQDQDKLATDAAMPDPNCKRWPKPEVQSLIRLRSKMDVRFREAGFKGPLWEEISSGMASLGFQRSAKRCKEKWENINKYFRKTKDNIKKRPQNAKTCPYFHQLNLLYSDNPKSSKTDQSHSSDDQADPDHENINDNNNGEDDEHAQTRPSDHSELLAAMIHGDQAGQTSLAKTNAATTTVHDHFFQDDHPVDQVQKRFKTRQHLPTGVQASNTLGIITESGSKPSAFEETFSGNIKKGSTMDSLVKEMLEMQQQKFLDAFERREHEQEQQQSMSSEERHHHHHPEETTQDDRSQSALMALVHKLTVNAPDYATG